MKRIRNIGGLLLTLALVAALAGHSSAEKGSGGKPGGDDGPTTTPIPYSITYLDTPPGFDSNSANGMNNLGEVVGNSSRAGGTPRAFLYTYDTVIEKWVTVSLHEKFKEEGLIPFDDSTIVAYAYDINDSGQIIGLVAELADDQPPSTAGFRYTPGFDSVGPQLVLLKSPDGGRAFGDAINNNGEIVGDGILWTPDVNGNLIATSLPGVGNISNGYVCGSSDGIVWRAPLTAGGVGPYQDLGTLFPKAKLSGSDARSINNAGEVAGKSYEWKGFNFTQHGYRYSNGTMQDLGTLGGVGSKAISINNHGDVVGLAQLASGEYHLFLYVNGVGMTDLEAAIIGLDGPVSPGGLTDGVNKINDHGEMCGNALPTQKAFILRPIIEP